MPELIAELRAAIDTQRQPQIMTPMQAAEFLGVSEHYLLDHRKRGTGPAYTQPAAKIVRYQRDDIIAWLDEGKVTS